MSDSFSKWLELCDCGKYVDVFAQNDIDLEVVTELTDADLEKLGVSLGHRKKLLKAANMLRVSRGEQASSADSTANSDLALVSEDIGAERRQLTVMFCDLVGSTELVESLDLEEYRDLLSSYQTTVNKSIGLFDGFVARYMGDGLLIYFGYPQAHEDDAERAVRAGLNVLAAIEDLSRHQGVELLVRIGIATGPVVAGDLIGEGAAEEQAVLGGTPNLAARLQSIATPGSVVISVRTRQLTRGLFVYEDLGQHSLKGFALPIQAWRVIAESSSESRFVATRRPEAVSLIGRDSELFLLCDRWERIRDSEGQVVLLSGEPGIGKSRLVHAFGTRVARGSQGQITFQCSPHHVNSAFYPFIEHIRRAAQIRLEDPPGSKLDKLALWLGGADEFDNSALALMASLLSIEDTDLPDLQLTPQHRKDKTIRLIARRITSYAQGAPVLVVVEDLHWADPTTLDVLSAVTDAVPDLAMMLVMTHRPEFVPPWAGSGHVTAHSLTRLGKRQVTQMIFGLAGEQRLPSTLVGDIVAKTDGVPLFVEEITKTILESDLPHHQDFENEGTGAPISVPSTLHDSLVARLDRLGQAKRIAQVASVIGREFTRDVLAAVSSMAESALADILVKLEHSELIHRQVAGAETVYCFKHALLQDAAYASLLKSRQKQLHARIVEVLESSFPNRVAEEPEVLAHHCTAAGLKAKAIVYWQEAAECALRRSAYRERLAHLDLAFRLIESTPDSHQRRQSELGLQIARGGTLMAARGFRAIETGEAFARARTLAAELGESRQEFAALRGLHGVHFVQAKFDIALEVAEACLRIACQGADPEHEALAHRLVGQTLYVKGDLQSGKEHLQQAFDLDSVSDSKQVTALVTGGGHRLMVSTFLAQVQWLRGFPDQALTLVKDALDQAEREYGAFDVAANLFFMCWIRGWRGEFDELQKLVKRLQLLSTEHDVSEWVSPGNLLADWATFASGDGKDVAALARSRLEAVRSLSGVMTPFKLGVLAEAMAVGAADEACVVVDEALELGRRGERWSQAELLRIKGEILARKTSQQAGAEECLQESLRTAHEQGARSWKLRAATALARLWHRQGSDVRARDLLAPVYGQFSEGFATADLKNAKALLETLRQ